MKRCERCKTGKLSRTTVSESVEVEGHLFTAKVPALVCDACDETYLDGPSLERLELQVAVALARAGVASGATMRFMRKALGLKATELAELLDVTPETVSRWETGKQSLEHRAMAVLGSLVIEREQKRTAMLETLQVLRKPKKLAKKVTLSLAAT